MMNMNIHRRVKMKHQHRSWVFVGIFALVGVLIVVRSFAATSPNAKVAEAESYSSTQDAASVTDATASGSSYIQFNTASSSGGTGSTGSITHGEELTEAMVGPWALQGVVKGSEQLDSVPAPSRGFWRFDTPSEFVPNGTYSYNNNPSNKGGTLAVDTMIDGYLVPAGTKVVQFRDLSASDFYAQGVGGNWLFRGVRLRARSSGTGFINDNQATYTLNVHYGDFGGQGPHDSQSGEVAFKTIGGQNHRFLRNYITYTATGLQPNVPGVEITENYIDKITFYYGEAGPCGSGGSCTFHLNGISSEGMSNTTPTRFKILRNRITVPSPDDAGHITTQTDCIALFQSNGGSYNDVIVEANYMGGSGYVIYAAANPNASTANEPKNVILRNNKITTKWWTNGGNYGPIAAQPSWGSNGNIATGNVWADDYGSGGNGNTSTTSRQYPSGNGPRKGQVIFGN